MWSPRKRRRLGTGNTRFVTGRRRAVLLLSLLLVLTNIQALDIPQVNFEIRQLEISHDDLYLAIVGEKEVSVCVLPGEGFLKRDVARPVVPQ